MRTVQHEFQQVVDTVICAMRENLVHGLSLADMADIACLSPYHFHRAFHRHAGVPPGEFQTGLRMNAAKRLLLTTTETVVDICFDVGFSSPSTFSSRFHDLVGVSPREFRHLPHWIGDNDIWNKVVTRPSVPTPAAVNLTGCVSGPADFRGLIFIGAFPRRIPQSLPRGGNLLFKPGSYSLPGLPDGWYFIMVAAIPETDPKSLFLPGNEMLVGTGDHPLQISLGRATHPVNIQLRSPVASDPPIVIALPTLLRRQADRMARLCREKTAI